MSISGRVGVKGKLEVGSQGGSEGLSIKDILGKWERRVLSSSQALCSQPQAELG